MIEWLHACMGDWYTRCTDEYTHGQAMVSTLHAANVAAQPGVHELLSDTTQIIKTIIIVMTKQQL